jgi:hypothetical protein
MHQIDGAQRLHQIEGDEARKRRQHSSEMRPTRSKSPLLLTGGRAHTHTHTHLHTHTHTQSPPKTPSRESLSLRQASQASSQESTDSVDTPTSPSRMTSPSLIRLASTHSGSSKGRSVFQAIMPGQVVEEDCLSQQVRGISCRIQQDGYVLRVEAAHCQTLLNAWHDSEAKRKLELVQSALDCHADLQQDLLVKIAACFVPRTVLFGAVLATQREPVEDIFIVQTAACGMRMGLRVERRMHDAHNRYSRPAVKGRKFFDISSAGPEDCLGLGEFFTTGCWDATVHVVESGIVLQASRKRLFSILEYYPAHVGRLRQQEAIKQETKHQRLLTCLANFQHQVCAGNPKP